MTTRDVFAASLIAAIGLGGCVLPIVPYDHYTAGMKALNAKDYPGAQKEFNLVTADNFRYQEAQFELGVVQYALHNVDAALQQMVKARDINPEQFAKEITLVKGLGLVHAELTQRWNVKTDGEIEDVEVAGDVMLTVSKAGVMQAHRQDQLLWENPLGPRGNNGRAVPVVDGGLVYVVKEKRPGQLLALRLDTGEVAWSRDLTAQYEFTNVAVDDRAVYVGDSVKHRREKGAGAEKANDALIALDKRSGRELWSIATDGMPGPIVASHGRVCTHTKTNRVFCTSASGQDKLVDYALAGRMEQTQPVMTDDTLYVALPDAMYALKFASAPLLWKQTIQEGGLSAPRLVDGGKKLVVQTRNALHAYDTATGGELWSVASPREDGAWSRSAKMPLDLGGTIVGWGRSFAFGVTIDGRLLWQLAVDGSVSAAPVSTGDGTLVLAVQGQKPELVGNAPRNLFVN